MHAEPTAEGARVVMRQDGPTNGDGVRPEARRRARWMLALAISLVTLCLYLPSLRSEFVLWDDNEYVYNNPWIRSLDWAFFRHVLTDASGSYWQPLTHISHAIDYALWGFRPAGHHLTNIVLHAVVTFFVVVFAMRLWDRARDLRVLAGGRQGSGTDQSSGDAPVLITAGVAGILFGIHPVHVESVAWVSERKDLLCALFFVLGMLAYLRNDGRAGPDGSSRQFFRRPSYWGALAFFALALLSKPMAVTLPLVLLLLDWYPLGRLRTLRETLQAAAEKVPFFLLSALVSLVTLRAQTANGAMVSLDRVDMGSRLLMAAKMPITYLRMMALPLDLSPFYPVPERVSIFSPAYAGAIAIGLAITAAAVLQVRRRPVIMAAWGYYLITLLPVMGVVRVGHVVEADRFTYLTSIGPFLLAGLATARFWSWTGRGGLWGRTARSIAVSGAAVLCLALGYGTVRQIGVWKDSITLWSAVIRDEPTRVSAAYHNRAVAYKARGELDRALRDLGTAIELEHGDTANTYNSRGLVYKELGQYDRAIEDFTKAIAIDPTYADAYTSRGWTFKDLGRTDQALADYNRAVALRSAHNRHNAYNNRGVLFLEQGEPRAAIADLSEAIALDPYFAEALTNRGLAYEQLGAVDRALADYTAAIKADPGFASAYNDRGLLYQRAGRLEDALADFTEAIQLNPSGVEAYNNRGLALESQGRFGEALADYDRAVTIDPDDALSYANRGIALRSMGRFEQAIADLTKAIQLRPDDAQAYMERAACYEAAGLPRNARRDRQAACRRGISAACGAH